MLPLATCSAFASRFDFVVTKKKKICRGHGYREAVIRLPNISEQSLEIFDDDHEFRIHVTDLCLALRAAPSNI